LTQITGLSRAIPFPIEGRFAIVTDVGFGMRWTRRLQGTNEADADGESAKETVKTIAQGMPGVPVTCGD
jgi:hypothetical protein